MDSQSQIFDSIFVSKVLDQAEIILKHLSRVSSRPEATDNAYEYLSKTLKSRKRQQSIQDIEYSMLVDDLNAHEIGEFGDGIISGARET